MKEKEKKAFVEKSLKEREKYTKEEWHKICFKRLEKYIDDNADVFERLKDR